MDNKIKLALLSSCLCGMTLTACSTGSPPKQELQLSEQSVSRAIDSGAENLAPDELASAQSKLAKAKKLIKKKKYKDAKTWLKAATIEAKLASSTAEASTAREKAAQLAAESAELQDQLSMKEESLLAKQQELDAFKELQATQTDRGMVLTLGDVLFTTNESTLNDSAMVKIERVAGFMQRYPERTITIEGHTDNTGDDNYNQELSLSRATAVMHALQSRNISADRISTRGMGEQLPIASNNNSAGRQQNRRVEIIFKDTKDMISEIDY